MKISDAAMSHIETDEAVTSGSGVGNQVEGWLDGVWSHEIGEGA